MNNRKELFIDAILVFSNPLLRVLGASENTFAMAKSYTVVIAIGAAFIFA